MQITRTASPRGLAWRGERDRRKREPRREGEGGRLAAMRERERRTSRARPNRERDTASEPHGLSVSAYGRGRPAEQGRKPAGRGEGGQAKTTEATEERPNDTTDTRLLARTSDGDPQRRAGRVSRRSVGDDERIATKRSALCRVGTRGEGARTFGDYIEETDRTRIRRGWNYSKNARGR